MLYTLSVFGISVFGLDAVLLHRMPVGDGKSIAFASRTLLKAGQNHSQIEKEALAIVYAVRRFYQYFFDRHFLLYTDHKPLPELLSELMGVPSMVAARTQRWDISLSSYNYTLKNSSGSENWNANFFSCFF